MKKLSLLLAALLMFSALFYGCSNKPAEQPPAEQPAVSEAVTPTAPADIIAHNLKIDPADIAMVQFDEPGADAKLATIKTSAGEIKLVLYPRYAPKAVENFLALAQNGYYNGTKIFEAIPSVRFSAGDPDGTGNGGKSSFADGAAFEDEYSLDLWHFNGAVAMDNGGVPGANGSRFYIVQNNAGQFTTELADKMLDEAGYPEKVVQKYLDVGGVPNYDAKDTVFGQVIEGMDVVEKIATAPCDENYKPKEDIIITSIEVK